MLSSPFLRSLALVLLGLAFEPLALPHALPQPTPQEDSQKKAWQILRAGANATNPDKRANAIQALGLTSKDAKAVQLAENALQDKEASVRTAAANALGAMGSSDSIPKLKDLLSDKDISVALAAAHALVQLKNNSGYDVYYSVLSGERKGGEGLIAEQIDQLRTPERAIKFAFDQGIGFLPYADYGMEALHAWEKRSTAPTRAAAARALVEDPDSRSGQALVKAASDKEWIVRAAALEAIAKREDPVLLKDIVPAMSDKKDIVRYSAAAAVLHLAHIAQTTAHTKE
jgi:HEAT repeat protein